MAGLQTVTRGLIITTTGSATAEIVRVIPHKPCIAKNDFLDNIIVIDSKGLVEVNLR